MSIGRREGEVADRRVFWSREMVPHRDQPYMASYLLDHHGVDFTRAAEPLKTDLSIPERALAMHSLLVGGSGYGKTRMAMHLLGEELRAGCSAVVMDFKATTIREALAVAAQAHIPAEQITLVWPREHHRGVPGWNPLGGDGAAVRHAVREFVGLVRAGSGDTGTRMWDVLTNAAMIVAGQGLSILELLRFLQSPDYMAGLLSQAKQTPAWEEFGEAGRYFELEFLGLAKSERASYVAPVLSRLRALADIPYLKAMLCARRDSLALPTLWQRQRLLLVHLDAWALGPDGTRLLAGMLAHSLYTTALRAGGPVPVVLMLDEVAAQENYLGDAIRRTLDMARSQNLRVIAACQSTDQLSDGLRSSLLTSTALRLFFRLSAEDAYRVARSLTVGRGGDVRRVTIAADPKLEETLEHTIEDPFGHALNVAPEAWARFTKAPSAEALMALLSRARVLRAYVRIPELDTTHALDSYLASLPVGSWSFVGPSPLRLRVRFPRPKVTVTEEHSEEMRVRVLAGRLQELPVQHAIIRAPDGEVAEVRAVTVTLPAELPDPSCYLSGQDERDIRETDRQRNQDIAALAPRLATGAGLPTEAGGLPPEPERGSDGSL